MVFESYEESNPADISIQQVFHQIQHHWPELRLEDIHFHYHGTYNVFFIQNQYILRIPDEELRNKEGVLLLQAENQKLRFLHKHLSPKIKLSLPDPLYLHKDPMFPYTYYRKLPGSSLCTRYAQLSHSQQTQVGVQIAEFLDTFHTQSLAQTFSNHFPELSHFSAQSYHEHWQSIYQQCQDHIFPLLAEEEIAWSRSLFTSFLDHPEFCQFTPTLIHGDFDTSNILIEPHSNRITAVIDFEDCQIGDPAADLLFFNEGSHFHKIITTQRHIKYDTHLRERMKFLYCRTFVPYMLWGMEHNRASLVEEGLKKLEHRRQQFPNPDITVDF